MKSGVAIGPIFSLTEKKHCLNKLHCCVGLYIQYTKA